MFREIRTREANLELKVKEEEKGFMKIKPQGKPKTKRELDKEVTDIWMAIIAQENGEA